MVGDWPMILFFLAAFALPDEIALSKAQNPQAFAALDAVIVKVPALDRARRGNLPIITPSLRRLGPAALMPMLDRLQRPLPTGLSASAARGLRLSLIEAVGMIRDPKATPVLTAILDGAQDFDTARLAAEALGRIGAKDELIARANSQAVLSG